MDYETKCVNVDAVKYEDGMEDGFVSILNDDETELIDVPFIELRNGKIIVDENSWIVTFFDGAVELYTEERFERMFRKVE